MNELQRNVFSNQLLHELHPDLLEQLPSLSLTLKHDRPCWLSVCNYQSTNIATNPQCHCHKYPDLINTDFNHVTSTDTNITTHSTLKSLLTYGRNHKLFPKTPATPQTLIKCIDTAITNLIKQLANNLNKTTSHFEKYKETITTKAHNYINTNFKPLPPDTITFSKELKNISKNYNNTSPSPTSTKAQTTMPSCARNCTTIYSRTNSHPKPTNKHIQITNSSSNITTNC